MDESKSPKLLTADINLSSVSLLSCDVDGVLTDGGIYYTDEGRELRRFHVHDGFGIQQLCAAGVIVAFITRSQTPSIEVRAKRLGVSYCFTGVRDKLQCLSHLIESLGLTFSQVAHVGDDINDLSVLRHVGISIAVSNAIPEVLSQCQFVTQKPGGSGAVREISDSILLAIELYKRNSQ